MLTLPLSLGGVALVLGAGLDPPPQLMPAASRHTKARPSQNRPCARGAAAALRSFRERNRRTPASPRSSTRASLTWAPGPLIPPGSPPRGSRCALSEAVIVSVEVPLAAIFVAESDAVTPASVAGTAVVKFTAPANPLTALTVTVAVAEPPGLRETLSGLMEI